MNNAKLALILPDSSFYRSPPIPLFLAKYAGWEFDPVRSSTPSNVKYSYTWVSDEALI